MIQNHKSKTWYCLFYGVRLTAGPLFSLTKICHHAFCFCFCFLLSLFVFAFCFYFSRFRLPRLNPPRLFLSGSVPFRAPVPRLFSVRSSFFTVDIGRTVFCIHYFKLRSNSARISLRDEALLAVRAVPAAVSGSLASQIHLGAVLLEEGLKDAEHMLCLVFVFHEFIDSFFFVLAGHIL